MYGGPTLYKIGLAISVPVLPISANVCNLCRKRLQSLPQTFEVKRRHYVGISSPMFFVLIHDYSTELVWGVREYVIRKKNRRLR